MTLVVPQQGAADPSPTPVGCELSTGVVVAPAVGVVDPASLGIGDQLAVDLADHGIGHRIHARWVREPLRPLVGRLALVDPVRLRLAVVHLGQRHKVIGQAQPAEDQAAKAGCLGVEALQLRIGADHGAAVIGLR